jgi:rhodanese-related sulfurtransferase
MPRDIAPATLRHLLEQGSTLALIDVREAGEYNTAHIPGASLLPRRQIEFRMQRLVPYRGVQVVVCDDDGRRARLAARTLEAMGYQRVAVLDGGINRWSVEGFPTEWGMNVISKDFGEMVEVRHHVPTIDAIDLYRRLNSGEPCLILDTRTPEEYRRFCIPGGRSVPGGELALRIGEIVAERPDTTVVVNCAGRTRSIIGARVLQRMGIANVVSLRNGTSGWVLAGLDLEQGAGRLDLPQPSPHRLAEAEAFAARVAAEDGVRLLSIDELDAIMARADAECVYLIDVRTREEFAAGHIPGFWWFPGGQAVQRADDVAAVRNAAIVFCCDGTVRSRVTASWYRQMGFPNVYAVTGGTEAWTAGGRTLEAGMAEVEPFGLAQAAARVRSIAPAALNAMRAGQNPPLIVFVDPSDEFAHGHVPGAQWLPRGRLELRAPALAPTQNQPIVVTDTDGRSALLSAATLLDLGYTTVAALTGGLMAWRTAGFPVEQGLSGVMQAPDDVVPAGPDRSYADMINYLRWEEALGRKYE